MQHDRTFHFDVMELFRQHADVGHRTQYRQDNNQECEPPAHAFQAVRRKIGHILFVGKPVFFIHLELNLSFEFLLVSAAILARPFDGLIKTVILFDDRWGFVCFLFFYNHSS